MLDPVCAVWVRRAGGAGDRRIFIEDDELKLVEKGDAGVVNAAAGCENQFGN